jgi:hypothetical protein
VPCRHVFCRQRQDERLRRGCEQKSIVLLSYLPLAGLLEPLARLVGPLALSYGASALREIFEEVQRWPPLDWGSQMSLPLLGMEMLSVELPLLTSLPGSALPAAVAASLGLQQPLLPAAVPVPQAPAQQPAAEVEGQQRAGSSEAAADVAASSRAEPAAASEGGEVAQAQAQRGVDAATAAQSEAVSPPTCLAAASPAQVAAALADELDGCDGLPLCLLPQAYGQQELAASPHGDCDCFTPLRGVLPQLWALWELLLLGEPLLVVAPSPGVSAGVHVCVCVCICENVRWSCAPCRRAAVLLMCASDEHAAHLLLLNTARCTLGHAITSTPPSPPSPLYCRRAVLRHCGGAAVPAGPLSLLP